MLSDRRLFRPSALVALAVLLAWVATPGLAQSPNAALLRRIQQLDILHQVGIVHVDNLRCHAVTVFCFEIFP